MQYLNIFFAKFKIRIARNIFISKEVEVYRIKQEMMLTWHSADFHYVEMKNMKKNFIIAKNFEFSQILLSIYGM